MVTANQILNFALFNRDTFSEIVSIVKSNEDDVLLDLIEDKDREIAFLRNALKIIRAK
tara:strand:- start:172 stop:345 length:174 start_codon:yes stop_codon:yes gene_type:complete